MRPAGCVEYSESECLFIFSYFGGAMQARIKLPTHAEIEFDGDDCGIGCLYLRAESWRSDDPTCTIPAHCLLFMADLKEEGLRLA